MRQPDWSRPTGEKDHKSFNDGGGATPDQLFGLRISPPGLGDMAVRGYQRVAYQETCAGNSCSNFRTLIREADMIDAINVTDRIAIAVEHERGHRLLLPEFFDLCRQFTNLGLKIVARCSLRSHWGIVNHGHRSEEYQSSNDQLHHAISAGVSNGV